MKKSLIILPALGVVIWLVVWGFGASAPDPVTAPTEEIRKFVLSKAFEDLGEEERSAYVRKVRELPEERRREVFRREGLTEKERSRLRRSMRGGFREQMLKEAMGFFELSPREQVARLDKRIDEMAARRKAWEERRKQAGEEGATGQRRREGRWRRGRMSADQIQKRMEQRLSEFTPRERARIREYWRRYRERLARRRGAR